MAFFGNGRKRSKYQNGDYAIKFYEDGRNIHVDHDPDAGRLIKRSFSTLKKKFGLW